MKLVVERAASPGRIGRHEGSTERHMPEAAVMLAMACWLFDRGAESVSIHPDGMHLKYFDVAGWLEAEGFERVPPALPERRSVFKRGATTVFVYSKSGLGDVVGRLGGQDVEIETKGGCINPSHAGQRSRLRSGLSEAVGQLMASPRSGVRLIAAVPAHQETERLASKLLPRCETAGIEIALVGENGEVSMAGGGR